MRSKLNLKDAEADEADEDKVQAEERLPPDPVTGVDNGREGVLTVVGVDEGVDEPIGVVATACLVDPDHFSYCSSRARSLSSNVGAAVSTESFSLSEISSMSLLLAFADTGGGDFGALLATCIGVGASWRRPNLGS